MNAKELRIGNWVNVGESKPFQVTGIFKEYIWALVSETDFPLKDVKPIPLTTEWLERFGLKQSGYNDEDKAIYQIRDHGVWILQNIVTKKFSIDQYEIEIKYVHQLQNLYFALTGEELINH